MNNDITHVTHAIILLSKSTVIETICNFIRKQIPFLKVIGNIRYYLKKFLRKCYVFAVYKSNNSYF